MTREIHRVLKPDGMFIMRFFIKPEKTESIEMIKNEFPFSQPVGFHAYKLRLAMAMHEKFSEGVCLKNVWDQWNVHFKDEVKKYQQQLQWNDAVISTIDHYRDSSVCYTFPGLAEIRQIINEKFDEEDIYVPDYYLGDRCPTLKLRLKK